MFRNRQLLTKCMTKRYFQLSNNKNIDPKSNLNNFIDYEKITSNSIQKNDLYRIENNLSNLNQTLNDQKYWIFHSVIISYIGIFTYIFKM